MYRLVISRPQVANELCREYLARINYIRMRAYVIRTKDTLPLEGSIPNVLNDVDFSEPERIRNERACLVPSCARPELHGRGALRKGGASWLQTMGQQDRGEERV